MNNLTFVVNEIKTTSDLDQAILKTIAYFSLFDYPLTTFEVWKWLFGASKQYSYLQVRQTLWNSDILENKLEHHNGFWGMGGTAVISLVATRHERWLDAWRKYKRLRNAVRYLSHLPSVRGIAACNTLGWNNTRADSDIDIFILVKEGSIWTTRLLAVSPFKVLKMRPGESRDPLCFSFFLTDTNLNIASLALEPDDPYLTFWTRSIVPVFDRDGVFSEFDQANGWAQDVLPNSCAVPEHHLRIRSAFGKARRVFGWLEKIAARVQRSRFPEVIQNMANRDSRVVVSDAILKFHDNDRREEFRDKLAGLVEE